MSDTKKELPEATVVSDGDESDDAVITSALLWSIAVFVVLALLGGGAAYFLLRTPEEETTSSSRPQLPEVRSTEAIKIPMVEFVDFTEASGIDFQHQNGAYGDKLLPETMGGGCALFDYDKDGDADILLVNSSRWQWDPRAKHSRDTMRLYRNDGDWKFTDVTAEAGLDVSFYGMGVAFADYDNDGDTDLFFSAVGPNRLFRNDEGKFVDVTSMAGVAGAENEWSTSCGWFDYDNDGDLDLFVCNYIQWSKEIDLTLDFQLVGVGRAYGQPTPFKGTFSYLYRNDGENRFTDVSAAAGIQVRNAATGVPMGKALGLAPLDIDQDGWMDFVVANDTVQNFLFHNQRDGTFKEIGAKSGIAYDAAGMATGAMGIDTGHFRNDQTIGVTIGNFSNEMSSMYVTMQNNLQFIDASAATGIGPPSRLQLTFGTFFFDYDLDGRLDVLGANGHLEDEINKVQASQHYEQPPQLFWNVGRGHAMEFVRVGDEQSGAGFVAPMVGRGAAFADLDADGDLDVLITATGGKPRLLRNDQSLGHHWIRLRLVGKTCNRDGIGAVIEVHTEGRVLRRLVMPTRSYLSQTELPLTFGLGETAEVKKVVVRWPDGKIQELAAPAADQLHQIEQQ